MRLYRGIHAGLFSGVGVLLLSASVWAQEPEETPAEEVAPEAPPAEPAPVPEPVAEAPVEEAPVEEAPVQEAPAAPAEEVAGGIGFSYLVFGDAYATVQTAQPGTAVPSHRAYVSNSPNDTSENGFSLNFAGIDLAYDSEHFGVTTSVRMGPGVIRYYGLAPSDGIVAFTQGFVTWKPTDTMTFDAGLFGTIYGAEVAESWMNLNYTRGALYFQMQPFWHTGLRGNFALTEELGLNAMIVNDVNQVSLDPNSNLQGGLQITYNTEEFGAALGTLQTLGEANASGFDRFVDLVLSYSPGDFTLLFNGDLNVTDNSGGTFYGLSLAAGYRFAPAFGVALRGEFLDLDADVDNSEIITGTLTLDTRPVPGFENVVLRWDNRIESSTGTAFFDGAGLPTDIWFSSSIGLAVYTDGAI